MQTSVSKTSDSLQAFIFGTRMDQKKTVAAIDPSLSVTTGRCYEFKGLGSPPKEGQQSPWFRHSSFPLFAEKKTAERRIPRQSVEFPKDRCMDRILHALSPPGLDIRLDSLSTSTRFPAQTTLKHKTVKMKFFVATAALIGAVAAHKNATGTGEVVWTTEIVTAYTTYCPAPTTVVVNNKTHTVTEATTLTITDCPCTISKPHTVTPGVPATSVPVKPTGTGAVPTGPSTNPTSPPQVGGAAAAVPFGAAALAALAML
ncbi:hypothetical protein A9K55_005540 [Cordyceps militaris]|uniref:Clock-controlled 6 n=1 Tax=Cordyceps militaris TaxID=73501 RepID=A0A2H4SAI2_CORMI|nr:hypothetical protein A9K55_005540 [Cordyceps militaris]